MNSSQEKAYVELSLKEEVIVGKKLKREIE